MKRRRFLKVSISPIFLLWVFAPGVLWATDHGVSSMEATLENSRERSPRIRISPEAVLHKLKYGQEIALVDIRDREDFEEVRIPGSLNIPFYALKAKTFLRSKPIVLIEEGYRFASLAKGCEKLRQDGFQVFILDGGLNSWSRMHGPLEGNLVARRMFNRIPPGTYLQEKDLSGWRLIDVSNPPKPIPAYLKKDALQIPFSSNDKESLSEFLSKMQEAAGRSLVLVLCNEEGRGYEDIEEVMIPFGVSRLFFIDGGFKGVETSLLRNSLQRKPRDERMKRLGSCRSCE
jgi:rhodanese-related sulfurtransferase